MRGGGGLSKGLNQMVDFIFYTDDKKVLLKPNENVVVGRRNYAFLGTFATSTIGKRVELGPVKQNKIKLGIETKEPTPLNSGEIEERAIAILENDLGLTNAEAAAQVKNIKQISSNEDNTDFFTVEGDKRLSQAPCNIDDCLIKTQVYAINVTNPAMFEKNGAEWFDYSNTELIGTMPIFGGHLTILREAIKQLGSSEGGRRRRTRKHKKSKKSKKGRGRKTRKHSGRKHSRRRH
jgi:hypothetical protein